MPSSLQPANRTTPVPPFYGINRGQARVFAIVNGVSPSRNVTRPYSTSTGVEADLQQGHGGNSASTNIGGASSDTGTGAVGQTNRTLPSPL